MERVLTILNGLFSVEAVGSKKEKRNVLFLKISAIALTLASSYTTFWGFNQYTPFPIALFLTIGVQGLLYASAWKIGAAIKSHNLKLLQVTIFLFALMVSVFFSYSSLLEVIYPKNTRLVDELAQRQNLVATSITSIKDSISNNINLTKMYDEFKEQFIEWNDTSSKEVARYFGTLTNSLDKSASKQKSLEYALSRSKQNYINNPDSLNQAIYNSSRYSETDNRQNKLFPTLTKFQRCKLLQQEHDSIFKTIISNNRNITFSSISDLQQKKRELFPLILEGKYSPKSIELPDSLKKQLIKVSEINNLFSYIDTFKVEKYRNITDLKFGGLNLIDRLPNSTKIDFGNIKNKLLEIDKYTGPNQHQFVVSVMLLKDGHLLAQGALYIALFIDLMVLFCGILGALPSSYLSLKGEEDIESVLDSSLENVFSLDGQEYSSAFHKKLQLILNNCEPAPTTFAKQGYPSVLRSSIIKQHNLSAQMGILISTSQAKVIKDSEDVYLRTRFLLWASEKLKI